MRERSFSISQGLGRVIIIAVYWHSFHYIPMGSEGKVRDLFKAGEGSIRIPWVLLLISRPQPSIGPCIRPGLEDQPTWQGR